MSALFNTVFVAVIIFPTNSSSSVYDVSKVIELDDGLSTERLIEVMVAGTPIAPLVHNIL